ncbi:MAG: S49 family peptidase [Candidatus Pacebacteria bacterium]|nr:S49 family peptidase [Candidatus Paceibacterota bacterium]
MPIEKVLKLVGKPILWGVAAIIVFKLALNMYGVWSDARSFPYSPWFSDGACNVAVVPLSGDILFGNPYAALAPTDETTGTALPYTDADFVVSVLRNAEQDPNVAAVMLQVDSYGGTPVASEVILDAMNELTKPSVALIREVGTSGAYMAAMGADTIIASPFSDVGSIGITSSYLQASGQNEREGLEFVSLSSGKFKDSGNPNKPLTAEERALFERSMATWHEHFVDLVATSRKMDREKVVRLADGSALPGALALEEGLVDMLGNRATAKAVLTTALGFEAVMCDY